MPAAILPLQGYLETRVQISGPGPDRVANRDPIELDVSSLPTMSGTSLWVCVRSLRGFIVGGAGAIVLCLIVDAAWILQLRDLAPETAACELVSLSVLLADNTDRTFQGVDLLLTLLAGRLEIALSMPSGRISTTSLTGAPVITAVVRVDPAHVIGKQGVLAGRSSFTGIFRLAGYADAQTYPITNVSSRDAFAIAETTSRSETMIVVAGLLVSALIITLIWVLSREMRPLQAQFPDGIERMSGNVWRSSASPVKPGSRHSEAIG